MNAHDFIVNVLRKAPPVRLDLIPGSIEGTGILLDYYPNNFVSDGEVHPRLAGVLKNIDIIEYDTASQTVYSLVFEDQDKLLYFKSVARNFERHANRLPNSPLGNALLAASFTDTLIYTDLFLKLLRNASHSAFGVHVLDMVCVDQMGNIKLEADNQLFNETNQWGELLDSPTLRIPLHKADDCPFHAIALIGVVPAMEGELGEYMRFEFAFQLRPGMPWSLLNASGFKPNRVVDYVRQYAKRDYPLTDHKKPFK